MSLINETDKYIFSTYKRFPIVLLKGKGTKVWDQDGKEYLDFVTGLAVCSLGHCHPKVVEAIEAQAKTLLHVSNLFHIKPQIELARLLVENSFADKVFFCNSGAEANEGAIKLTRKYMRGKKEDRFEIIAMHDAFHGRTLSYALLPPARISLKKVLILSFLDLSMSLLMIWMLFGRQLPIKLLVLW